MIEAKVGADELSLAAIQELVAATVQDRVALRWRGRDVSHRELATRSRQLANFFVGHGLGAVAPRAELQRWQAGQDFVGILMNNRPEYIEVMFGAFKARCVPYNINYRYGAAEVQELLRTAPTRALFYEAAYGELVEEVRQHLPADAVIVEISDGVHTSVKGASRYEDVLAASPSTPVAVRPSPDDLYVVFTGGTTGRPKAVMWRQADAFASALSGPTRSPGDVRPYSDLVVGAITARPRVALAAPPFMHGGGQWVALANVLSGDSVTIQSRVDRLDSADIWSTVEADRVNLMLITGNAYGVPLVDELQNRAYDLRSLKVIVTGAVAMTSDVKDALLKSIPGVRIVETVGATESGTHLRHVATGPAEKAKTYRPSADTVVLDESKRRRLQPGHQGAGWLARRGRIPLGYLDDEDRTISTFPTIDGIRYSVPGDRARLLDDGDVEFLGRDSVTINSGGEKVFAEEVEEALAASPEVYDVMVAGKEHPRWGEEVVALVSLRPGMSVTDDELKERVAKVLARYKVPKRIAFVDRVPRNAVGKADYTWAKTQASQL